MKYILSIMHTNYLSSNSCTRLLLLEVQVISTLAATMKMIKQPGNSAQHPALSNRSVFSGTEMAAIDR
jgi:hypothetical protein